MKPSQQTPVLLPELFSFQNKIDACQQRILKKWKKMVFKCISYAQHKLADTGNHFSFKEDETANNPSDYHVPLHFDGKIIGSLRFVSFRHASEPLKVFMCLYDDAIRERLGRLNGLVFCFPQETDELVATLEKVAAIMKQPVFAG